MDAESKNAIKFRHGNRTLPGTLDYLALSTPDRLYASIPRGRDLVDGYLDVSCADMARSVNFMVPFIISHFGRSDNAETLAYIGIPDLRSAVSFLAAVKAGYKVLLPSPRNAPSTNHSLMQQTSCRKILYAPEVAPVIKEFISAEESSCLMIPTFHEMLQSTPSPYPYEKPYEDIQNDPIVVLHSSGSTGLPKPITMTHATFAVLDRERYLPGIPGRRNRDYSIWDFNGGGRFYTVFPYFHLAGFLSLLVNPIFTESSSPVLGPPLMPPSGSLLKEVMKHQKLRALYLPPSIAEQLLLEPQGLDLFKGLDFLCYTGAPFSTRVGEQLAQVTELCPLYGSTEAFQVPQLAPAHPEDWAWMQWNPHFKFEMQLDETGVFELVLGVDASTEKSSALNHNMPGISEYRTKDLFKQHPTKPDLWQYYGRRDDIIVLSNGEKFNPVPMELSIQGNQALTGALFVGQGRPRATLLVEPKSRLSNDEITSLIEAIWPSIEESNHLLPAQGRILRSNVLVSNVEKPFVRAGKGTVVRKLTEQLYEPEIDAIYASDIWADSIQRFARLEPKLHFETGTILEFVRDVIVGSFPEFSDVGYDDDLFSAGLDSLMITQAINHLQHGLKDAVPGKDFTWLDTRTVYRNSSIRRLSIVLSHFLDSGHIADGPTQDDRIAAMDELVEKYTRGLTTTTNRPRYEKSARSVALVGSTGYLGPQILASLLTDSKVSAIYCLNRGLDSRERTISALRAIDDGVAERSGIVQFFVADLDSERLGLSLSDFNTLLSNADTIIYNSWKPDFSIPLPSFEKPVLPGLRIIIDWAVESPRGPRIMFISSIAAVGNWSNVFPQELEIPESRITDARVAMHMGYGESKCVAERILQIAHDNCGVPVNVIRFGQVGGCVGSNSMNWPVQGWLLAIIRTSKALGALPTHVAPVDWIPVDTLARQISELVKESSIAAGYHVFNLVHPKVAPWELFLDTLLNYFSFAAERIDLPMWIDRVERAAVTAEPENQRNYVALKFSDFLRSMGNGREDMRCVSRNIGRYSSKVATKPISEELLARWLQQWKF